MSDKTKQREIKFKIWRPTSKHMTKMFDLHEELTANNGDGGNRDSECVFLQFTGLHDKNGKEIYEGDIIRVSNFRCVDIVPDESGTGTREIFEDADFEVSFGDGIFIFESEDHGDVPVCATSAEDREVIGDIYRNPEIFHPL